MAEHEITRDLSDIAARALYGNVMQEAKVELERQLREEASKK